MWRRNVSFRRSVGAEIAFAGRRLSPLYLPFDLLTHVGREVYGKSQGYC